MNKNQQSVFSIAVIVGALGFFVDIFDLLLFNIIRKPSLSSLGLSEQEVLSHGELILSLQMFGQLLGGIVWGVMGDKKGRLSVLFGSIVLYSIATIANGFVTDVTQYTILRFIAGFGLAGELGASITLTSEMLPKEKRGIASTVIATTGVLGSITAYVVFKLSNENWRLCYYIGGGMGIALLFLRVSVMESGMFASLKEQHIERGNFAMFFTNKERLLRYLRGICIGLPVWYAIGVLITFSDKFGKEMGIENVEPAKAVVWQYAALVFGDVGAGLLGNYLKSRKKALFVFYAILSIFIVLFFLQNGNGTAYMYWMCAGLGLGSGISVLYITMSAEQFGTNLRASAAISIPNMVRGFLPLILLLFKGLRSLPGIGYIKGGWITGIVVMLVAIVSAYFTKESYGKDLNFIEE
jgi:putative MFS transporter